MTNLERPVPTNRKWLLQMAIQNGLQEENVTDTASNDVLEWRWTTSKEYSAKSFFDVMVSGGKMRYRFRFIWHLPVLPTVRVFAFLCLQDKLLTHEIMARMSFHCELRCDVCQVCSLETTLHLFFQCGFSILFWQRFSILAGLRFVHREDSVQSVLTNSSRAHISRAKIRKWRVVFFAGCWYIWRNRNKVIFEGNGADPITVTNQAWQDVRLRLRYC